MVDDGKLLGMSGADTAEAARRLFERSVGRAD